MANVLEQQTFVDHLSDVDAALSELSAFANTLANRLVGYANEAQQDDPADASSSNGFLPGVVDTAFRMSRKIEDIRCCLNRINQVLPAEHIKAVSNGGQISSLGTNW